MVLALQKSRLAGYEQLDASLDAAMQSGDRAQLAELSDVEVRRRTVAQLLKRSFDNASAQTLRTCKCEGGSSAADKWHLDKPET